MVKRLGLLLVLGAVLAAVAAVACTKEVIKEVQVEKPVIVEREVIKEVPVEKIVTVEKEVIREVPVEKIVIVEKEVVIEVSPTGEVMEKVLRVRMSNMSPQFSPHIQARGDMFQIGSWIGSRLVQPDPLRGQWAPDLADRWDLAEDFMSMTFHLRKNATWHDGTPFTAKDVEYSVKSYLHPEQSSWMLATFWALKGGKDFQDGKRTDVPGLIVVDDYTIRFEFDEPNAFFMDDMANVSGQVPPMMLPEHILGNVPDDELFKHTYFLNDLTATGPWKLVKWVPDQFLEMEAFDEFYFGRPGIDRIIMSIIPSADATQIAMQRGEIDTNVRGGVSQDAEDAFLRDPRFNVWATMGSGSGGFVSFNGRDDSINMPELHQGWAQAIDKETLFQTFARGIGRKAWTPLVHSWYFKPEWGDLYPYDPGAAKALIKKSGFDTNRTLSLLSPAFRNPDEEAQALALQQYMADVGVKYEFDIQDTSVRVKRFYEEKDYVVSAGGGGGIQGGPAQYLGGRWLSCEFQKDNPSCDPWGYAAFKGPSWDKLVLDGMAIVDRAESAKYWQMVVEDHMQVDLPIVGSWVGAGVKVANKRFIIPAFGEIRQVDRIRDLKIFPIHISRDDWWSYHPEQWQIKEQQ